MEPSFNAQAVKFNVERWWDPKSVLVTVARREELMRDLVKSFGSYNLNPARGDEMSLHSEFKSSSGPCRRRLRFTSALLALVKTETSSTPSL